MFVDNKFEIRLIISQLSTLLNIHSLKMKKIKSISIIILCAAFLFSTTSCVVLVGKDNGRHNGWFKNQNNPHNPQSAKQNKSNGKSIK